MSVIRDCTACDGQPGGCGYCRGTGVEPLTEEETNQISGDALETLNDDGVPRKLFEVIEGGKSDI